MRKGTKEHSNDIINELAKSSSFMNISYKSAILENGEKIQVPPHIDAGTKVVVNTSDGSYVEKAK